MISYSTNWMGPISTKWYEDRNIPFVMKRTKGIAPFPARDYKDYVEYSCGRIDIYGLDEEEYYAGKSEYGVATMRHEDWNDLSEWLDTFETKELVPYSRLLEIFERTKRIKIRWYTE